MKKYKISWNKFFMEVSFSFEMGGTLINKYNPKEKNLTIKWLNLFVEKIMCIYEYNFYIRIKKCEKYMPDISIIPCQSSK
jgi:hypothetical protein